MALVAAATDVVPVAGQEESWSVPPFEGRIVDGEVWGRGVLDDKGKCKVCGGKFTLRRPLSAKPLTHCPACKKPVRKIISTFNSPHKLKPLSISDAKKAGFTVLKKVSKGEYERQ